MVTLDFKPEMRIWPICACAMKNVQYNLYLRPNRRNSRALQEIGVEEDDGHVRFHTANEIVAVLRMRTQKCAI